jgi:hypothetical protein
MVSFTPRPLHPPRKKPRYILDRRLGGPPEPVWTCMHILRQLKWYYWRFITLVLSPKAFDVKRVVEHDVISMTAEYSGCNWHWNAAGHFLLLAVYPEVRNRIWNSHPNFGEKKNYVPLSNISLTTGNIFSLFMFSNIQEYTSTLIS